MAESETGLGTTDTTQRKRGSAKRTARACDECRLRKSKCDGLNPCEACQTTDRYCTYNLSAARGTNSGTRIRILEDRLRRARAYLVEAQRRTPSLAGVNFDALLGPVENDSRRPSRHDTGSEDDANQDTLDSMMNSYGQLTMGSNGRMHRDFYGAASGLAWIQRAGSYFEGTDRDLDQEAQDVAESESAAVQLFDAPLPGTQPLHADETIIELLPSRATADKLLEVVFKQVYPMFHFLCEDDFAESMDRIYQLHPSHYEEEDQAFIPLFWSVMGLGYLFSKEDHDKMGCKGAVAQGMRNFVAARNSVDIAQVRTITALQCLISLILFLVSTARMASAHAFLGAACASAMRQGLHFRSTHDANLSAREKRVRRRVFWSVMNLDLYISGILGLPQIMDLSAVDPAIDTTIEIALNDVQKATYLTSGDKLALAASAKHIELMRILLKAQVALYPKPTDPPDSKKLNGTISVSLTKLQKVEDQFRAWAESLADVLSRPDDSEEAQSVRYEISICYYFAQIVLYRAFLHYLAKQHEDSSIGQRQLSYAKTCVKMARKVIELSVEHQKRGLLCPASWSSVYTVFIATVCLVFAYATRRKGSSAPEIKSDIENAIRMLCCTACTTDTGSVRCLEILRRLIKRVSYAVDIDVDDICANTESCCTTDFSDFGQPNRTDAQTLHIPDGVGSDFSQSQTSSQSQSQSQAQFDSSQGWSLSPDAMLRQPSFTGMSFANYNAPQSTSQTLPPVYSGQDEEMMEVPYGGTFSWPQHEFHEAALRMGQPAEVSSVGGGQQPQSRASTASNAQTPISSNDIAAFMHINPVDESYRFREPRNR